MGEDFLPAEEGRNPKVILIMGFSEGGDVIIAQQAIRELSDLRGKRVGVEITALGSFMLTRALEQIEQLENVKHRTLSIIF